MQRGELESAFERWRSQGDLKALERVIDGASPELLSLAARLAPDLADAEDLVQTTFLALIEKPHAWDARRPLIPWLVGILTKRALDSKRTSRRHIEPTALPERAVDAPERLAADAETGSAVRRALEQLPPLYREVVTRSVLDGERPLEIARTLDRAPGTVRTQLLRGLELLRRALPTGLAGGGALVLAGTRGEAAIRAHVLSRAAELPIAAAPLVSIPLLGGALVSTKLLVASAAVVVAALATWLAWPGDPIDPPSASLAAKPSPPSAAHSPETAAIAQSTADAPRAIASSHEAQGSAATSSEGWWLVGTVRGARAEDLSAVEVHVALDRGPRKRVLEVRDDGTFELELSSLLREPRDASKPAASDVETPPRALPALLGALHVTAQHPAYLTATEVPPAEALASERAPGERVEIRCDLKLLVAATVRGIARCEPVSSEKVEVVLLGGDSHSESRIESGGEFRLRTSKSGSCVVRASCPGYASAAARVELVVGRELEVPPFVLERTTVAIEGRVDLPEGIDLSKLEIQAGHRDWESFDTAELPTIGFANSATIRAVRGAGTLASQRARVASDGAFRLEGLVRGTWRIEIGGLPAMLHGEKPTHVEAPSRNVVLGTNLGLIRLLVESDGKPVPRARSKWSVAGSPHWQEKVSDKGRITVIAPLDIDYTVQAIVERGQGPVAELPAVRRPRVLDVVLDLPTFASPKPAILELVPPTGATAPRLLALLLRERREDVSREDGDRGEGRIHSPGASLADGRYRVEVASGRWTVDVGPGSEQSPPAFFGSFLLTQRFEVDLQPGARVELPLQLRAGGRLRVHPRGVEGDARVKATWSLVDSGGRPIEGRFWTRRLTDGRPEYQDLSPIEFPLRLESAFEHCLEPGRYTLTIDSSEWQAAPASFEIEAGKTTEIELRLWAK